MSKSHNAMEAKPLVVWPEWLHKCRGESAKVDESDYVVPSKVLDGELHTVIQCLPMIVRVRVRVLDRLISWQVVRASCPSLSRYSALLPSVNPPPPECKYTPSRVQIYPLVDTPSFSRVAN